MRRTWVIAALAAAAFAACQSSSQEPAQTAASHEEVAEAKALASKIAQRPWYVTILRPTAPERGQEGSMDVSMQSVEDPKETYDLGFAQVYDHRKYATYLQLLEMQSQNGGGGDLVVSFRFNEFGFFTKPQPEEQENPLFYLEPIVE